MLYKNNDFLEKCYFGITLLQIKMRLCTYVSRCSKVSGQGQSSLLEQDLDRRLGMMLAEHAAQIRVLSVFLLVQHRALQMSRF